MKLHNAIEKVLLQHRRPMKASEIAAEVNKQGLYQRGDLQPVPSSQIHARVKNYPAMFKKENGLISLSSFRKQELDSLLAELKFSLGYKPSRHFSLSLILLVFYKFWLDNYSSEKEYEKEDFYIFLEKIFEKKGIPDSFSKNYFQALKDERLIDHYAVFQRIGNYDFTLSSSSGAEIREFFHKLIDMVFAQKFMQGQFTTPPELAGLISKISGLEKFTTVYNPAAGINSLAVELKKTGRDFHFAGEDTEVLIFLIGYVNLHINQIEAGAEKTEAQVLAVLLCRELPACLK